MWNQVRDTILSELSDLEDAAGVTRVALRLLFAGVLGGLLGYQREHRGKSAGLRTHVLVAMGAAMFAMVPQLAGASPNDMTRVVQGIVVGIGFLGAGAILRQPSGTIRGLTTAASLWVTTAIGLAVGVGYYEAAIAVTVATLVALYGLLGVRRFIRRRLAWGNTRAVFRLTADVEPREFLHALQTLPKVKVLQLRFEREEEGAFVINTLLSTDPGAEPLETLLAPLADRDDVEEMALVR